MLDPACGSGAFLNEVFDFLFQEGQVINGMLEMLYGGQINLFRWDTHILSRNIFGVDINRESVEITKLSLWLKTANRNEKLSYLDDNVRAGNSLIKDQDVAGELAFDWKIAFPNIMAAGGFDVVLGNPPYVDSEAMTKVWSQERDYIAKHFRYTKGNWDLYVAFLELGCDLITPDGYQRRAASPKVIIKGLTLLEGALDLDAEFIPGKATIVICHDSSSLLKQVAAVVNSKLASFYVKQKYASASYNGGVNFTPDMVNSIPVPKMSSKLMVREVDQLVKCRYQVLDLATRIHKLISASSTGNYGQH